MYSMRFVLSVMVATCGLTLASPSAGMAADGKVTGLITLHGRKPVEGKVTFHLDDQFVGAKVKEDGRFTVNRVPVGTYKVTIAGKGIPEKFASEDITPLRVEVKEGANQLDFRLE